jgi:hypothetical protein
MKYLTQTNLEPGNCFQTCLAMLLDVDVDDVPNQNAIEAIDRSAYQPAVEAWLFKHFDRFLVDLQSVFFDAVEIPGWHIMNGSTIRTPTNKRNHCVLGRRGRFVWDPHPSRAGLVEVTTLSLLAKPTPWWRSHHENGLRDESAAFLLASAPSPRVPRYHCVCRRCAPAVTWPIP